MEERKRGGKYEKQTEEEEKEKDNGKNDKKGMSFCDDPMIVDEFFTIKRNHYCRIK